MKILIFIHGADSFLDDDAYVHFLQNDYILRYTKPWEDVEKVDYRKVIAKKWKEQGGQVWYPAMPNKQNARYRDWKIVFESILARLSSDDEVTFLGGSLGGCFLLKYFSELNQDDSHFVIPMREESLSESSDGNRISTFSKVQKKKMSPTGQKMIQIRAIHLIAACIAEGDFTAPMNYEVLNILGSRVYIWHAEDDPIVPFSIARELEKILPEAQMHFFPASKGYGHFHGIPAFPELEGELLEN